MIRNSLFALAAAVMTLSTFTGTLAIMSGEAPAGAQQAPVA